MGRNAEELDPAVARTRSVSVSTNDDYFVDRYQAIPQDGYTKMIENILAHPLIEVRLNAPYDAENFEAENVYYTGPIDEFFNYELGELPYRSLEFDIREENTPYFQNGVVVSYPNNYDFTRICEHKYFLNDKSDRTVISLEYPAAFERGKNERYYPVPGKIKILNCTIGICFWPKIARMFISSAGWADYRYYNMDVAVARALALFKELY